MSPIRFRAIVPVGTAVDLRAAEQEIKAAVTSSVRYGRRLYSRTTTGWKKRPGFSIKRGYWLGPYAIAADTFTTSDVYRWIDLGTKARTIRPRRSRMLRFRTGYRASTRRRSLTSRRAQRYGAVAWAKKVKHPGIKPRQFSEEVADRMQPHLRRQVLIAMSKVAQRSRRGGSRLV